MRILGMNIQKYVGKTVEGSSGNFVYKKEIKTAFLLYGEEAEKKFQIRIWEEEGLCGSGYTSASWGRMK